MATITDYPSGRTRQVKNLGWLLAHAPHVTDLVVTSFPNGRARLAAMVRRPDGGESLFSTSFNSAQIAHGFAQRRAFAHVSPHFDRSKEGETLENPYRFRLRGGPSGGEHQVRYGYLGGYRDVQRGELRDIHAGGKHTSRSGQFGKGAMNRRLAPDYAWGYVRGARDARASKEPLIAQAYGQQLPYEYKDNPMRDPGLLGLAVLALLAYGWATEHSSFGKSDGQAADSGSVQAPAGYASGTTAGMNAVPLGSAPETGEASDPIAAPMGRFRA